MSGNSPHTPPMCNIHLHMAAILHQNAHHTFAKMERKRTFFNQLNQGMIRWQV
uniref:Uncharacterized protein n=1 Tax=Anguilla anguilla TaxID=7936 RepID=A0A0E9PSU5_ANGAN